jgi:hypothetical protein
MIWNILIQFSSQIIKEEKQSDHLKDIQVSFNEFQHSVLTKGDKQNKVNKLKTKRKNNLKCAKEGLLQNHCQCHIRTIPGQ